MGSPVASGQFGKGTVIVTGAGAGGGQAIKLFSGAGQSVLQDFQFGSPGFNGGVSAAGGLFDGHESLIVGKGQGGAPEVRVFDVATLGVGSDFFAFNADFRGGVNVASSYPRFHEVGLGGVPEPASWALMILGLGAVGGRLRAQRRPRLSGGLMTWVLRQHRL